MRQVDTHKSLVVEVHNVRRLQSLLESPAARVSFDEERLREALLLLKQHKDVLFSVRYTTHAERKNDAHAYIESVLPALLLWSNEQELWHQRSLRTGRTQEPPPLAHFQYSPHTAHMLVSQVQLLVHRLMHERGKRWMALQTAPFPTVHYLTLALLALSIVISFLVATAQAEFIFLRGMPVRVLWSVLITSFSALGVVCFDLARPFGGAYHIL